MLQGRAHGGLWPLRARGNKATAGANPWGPLRDAAAAAVQQVAAPSCIRRSRFRTVEVHCNLVHSTVVFPLKPTRRRRRRWFISLNLVGGLPASWPPASARRLLQTFKEELIFNTGTRRTGFLFSLKLLNRTLKATPLDQPRRFEELYYMSYLADTVSRRPSRC